MTNVMTTEKFHFDDYNQGFVVSIALRAREGEQESVAKLLAGLVKPTMEEPGVKLFLPYRSPDDIRNFLLFELYVDEAGWQAHQETEHFKTTIAELGPRLEKRERIPFVPFV